jgi:DNA topoisomerase-1
MKDKSLVIVESPTKAKTISKILGKEFVVVSTMVHLIDLPQKELGVSIEEDFLPTYVVIPGRQKVLASLKKESKDKKTIFVATDPDREGEAIGWQVRDRLFKKKKVLRVVFHEITPAAVREAFKHARDFDLKMVEAQAGRRILDRIVGYFLSPLLWKKIVRGLSAGRVQSVTLRLIVEREKEIGKFIPQEYWEIEAELSKLKESHKFIARLEKIVEEKAAIKNKQEADNLVNEITPQKFIVSEIKKAEKKRSAPAPFITSTLQQEAFNKLRFSATKTMIVAQQLYEGIDIEEEASVGLITYMRTDSTRAAPEAIKEARGLILKQFGKEYLPETPNVYKVKKLAQEAHEAIRPTLLGHSPESLKNYLTPDQYKLYTLIYQRFLASQMTPAVYAVTTVDIQAGKFVFVATGSELVFAGFSAVYSRNNTEEDEDGQEQQKKNTVKPLSKVRM